MTRFFNSQPKELVGTVPAKVDPDDPARFLERHTGWVTAPLASEEPQYAIPSDSAELIETESEHLYDDIFIVTESLEQIMGDEAWEDIMTLMNKFGLYREADGGFNQETFRTVLKNNLGRAIITNFYKYASFYKGMEFHYALINLGIEKRLLQLYLDQGNDLENSRKKVSVISREAPENKVTELRNTTLANSRPEDLAVNVRRTNEVQEFYEQKIDSFYALERKAREPLYRAAMDHLLQTVNSQEVRSYFGSSKTTKIRLAPNLEIYKLWKNIFNPQSDQFKRLQEMTGIQEQALQDLVNDLLLFHQPMIAPWCVMRAEILAHKPLKSGETQLIRQENAHGSHGSSAEFILLKPKEGILSELREASQELTEQERLEEILLDNVIKEAVTYRGQLRQPRYFHEPDDQEEIIHKYPIVGSVSLEPRVKAVARNLVTVHTRLNVSGITKDFYINLDRSEAEKFAKGDPDRFNYRDLKKLVEDMRTRQIQQELTNGKKGTTNQSIYFSFRDGQLVSEPARDNLSDTSYLVSVNNFEENRLRASGTYEQITDMSRDIIDGSFSNPEFEDLIHEAYTSVARQVLNARQNGETAEQTMRRIYYPLETMVQQYQVTYGNTGPLSMPLGVDQNSIGLANSYRTQIEGYFKKWDDMVKTDGVAQASRETMDPEIRAFHSLLLNEIALGLLSPRFSRLDSIKSLKEKYVRQRVKTPLRSQPFLFGDDLKARASYLWEEQGFRGVEVAVVGMSNKVDLTSMAHELDDGEHIREVVAVSFLTDHNHLDGLDAMKLHDAMIRRTYEEFNDDKRLINGRIADIVSELQANKWNINQANAYQQLLSEVLTWPKEDAKWKRKVRNAMSNLRAIKDLKTERAYNEFTHNLYSLLDLKLQRDRAHSLRKEQVDKPITLLKGREYGRTYDRYGDDRSNVFEQFELVNFYNKTQAETMNIMQMVELEMPHDILLLMEDVLGKLDANGNLKPGEKPIPLNEFGLFLMKNVFVPGFFQSIEHVLAARSVNLNNEIAKQLQQGHISYLAADEKVQAIRAQYDQLMARIEPLKKLAFEGGITNLVASDRADVQLMLNTATDAGEVSTASKTEFVQGIKRLNATTSTAIKDALKHGLTPNAEFQQILRSLGPNLLLAASQYYGTNTETIFGPLFDVPPTTDVERVYRARNTVSATSPDILDQTLWRQYNSAMLQMSATRGLNVIPRIMGLDQNRIPQLSVMARGAFMVSTVANERGEYGRDYMPGAAEPAKYFDQLVSLMVSNDNLTIKTSMMPKIFYDMFGEVITRRLAQLKQELEKLRQETGLEAK